MIQENILGLSSSNFRYKMSPDGVHSHETNPGSDYHIFKLWQCKYHVDKCFGCLNKIKDYLL